jgi:branched-chain amino acid aminotransferase
MAVILTNSGFFPEASLPEKFVTSGPVVYEVIRVIDQIPLFLADHFERLVHSASFQQWKFDMDLEEFRKMTAQLIQLNQKTAGNIRFEYGFSGEAYFWSYRFIQHSYPSTEDYRNGVKTDLIFDERPNPNAKVVQAEIREKCNRMLVEQGLYEVLLVDRHGMITEGSRSNVFFVKDDVFYTAPDSMVLVGITRQKVISCLSDLGYRLVEEPVAVNRLGAFDAVFLTGTSPKVLPVSTIGNQKFATSNACVRVLIDRYDQLIDRYIQQEISGK